MAWRRIGDKQLPKSMINLLIDTYMRRLSSLCWNYLYGCGRLG